MDFFDNLFRIIISDPIGSEVGQCDVAEELTSSDVKKATDETIVLPTTEEPVVEDATVPIEKPIEQGTLDDDINTLARHLGLLQRGQTISMELHEMLTLCPRPKRPRSDAYNALSRKLKDEYGVELVIISTKNKPKQ